MSPASALQADPRDVVAGADLGQQRLGLARRQLAAHPARGELGEQPVQPAHRLGPQRAQLLAPVAQQPQAGQHVIGCHQGDPAAVQGGQADGHGVVPVGLAAVALRVNPDPGGQLRGNVQDQLAVSDQPLRQGPPRTAAALHRPAAVLPLRAKPASSAYPSSVFANRAVPVRVFVTGSSTAAVLLALCGSTAIITSSLTSYLLATGSTWRGGQCNFRQRRPLLSHILTGEQRTGRRPFVSQSTPAKEATAADSRASPSPLSAPRITHPRAPGNDLNKLPITSGGWCRQPSW